MQDQSWHAMETARIPQELEVDPQVGLSEQEARLRLDRYGPNELQKEEPISAWRLFFRQFRNVLILILLVAIALSIAVGEMVDAGIIALIVLFSALLGFVQEYRAERALESLKKMLSPSITVLRDGRETEVLSKSLVPGDVLVLEAGDRVPADARLIEAHSMKCDEASLTGESVPVSKDPAPVRAEAQVGDRKNMIFAGTVVAYGRGRAVVTATGMRTEFGAIAREVAAVETKETPLEKRTAEVGKWLGILAVSVCFLVAGVSLAREAVSGEIDFPFLVNTVMFAVALAVAAVPEALAAIVTGALAIGMRQMARRNALVRRMPAVETLGATTVICSDKTGTLTKGEMTVRKLYVSGAMVEVTGGGYEPRGDFIGPDGSRAGKGPPLGQLLRAALLCNDAALEQRDGKWAIKGDPTEGGLVVAAAKAGLDQAAVNRENPRTAEIPFSSERKRMTTIHRAGDGKRMAFMKGAAEEVLGRSSRILGDGGVRVLEEADRARLLEVNEEMARSALRVLAVACREVPDGGPDPAGEEIERDMVFLGFAGMMDPPREEAVEAVKTCREVSIRVVMITGDHEVTASAIAREIGICREGDLVLNGEALEKMADEELARIVDRVSVYARVSPMHKIKIVRAWKSRGEVVAMTGDGVNDAPALKNADIGIAMGITGTDVTKDASDMVLSDDNFATIVKAVERGRWIYDNIKKYLTYLLRCNLTEVMVIGGIVLALGPEYLPLLPAAILYINLATDGLPALALGIAPPEPDLMRRPPRDPAEGVFSLDVKLFILIALLIEVPFFLYFFFKDLPDLDQARTRVFFLFILVELIIALNFRSMRYSAFRVLPHKWLLLAIFWEIVLIAVLIRIPSVREAFGILEPSAGDLAVIVGVGAVVFASMEGVKLFLRRRLSL
ncbi:MAG: cation-translocating P-type ATPase [bacterium]